MIIIVMLNMYNLMTSHICHKPKIHRSFHRGLEYRDLLAGLKKRITLPLI